MRFKLLFGLSLAIGCVVSPGLASVITVGSDGAGPVQLFANDGSSSGTVGPDDGTAISPDGSGGFFVAEPGDTSSMIDDYDSSQNFLSSFLFTAPGDNDPDGAYIIDMTWGAGGTLWVTTFDGEVYNLASTGQVLSSFATGITAPGIAFDGTDLYTDSGPGYQYPSGVSPFIYQMDTAGNILNTLDTGLSDTLGLSIGDSGFWVGGFDVLSQVGLDGTVLNQYSTLGTHYGVEEGNLSPAPTQAPEPSALLLALIGLSGIVLSKNSFRKFARGSRGVVTAALLLPAGALHAAVSISSISPSAPSPQPVGTSITFTVAASDTDPGSLRYQYSVRPSGGGAFSLISDYSPSNTIAWTPADNEGAFEVQVVVLNRSTQTTQAESVFYTISSRVSGGAPVVNPTIHPLVALYSAPACASGSTMRVRFKLTSDIAWQSTQLKNCTGSTSMNFYVAGMRATSQYQMRQDVITGPRVVSGPILTFTTGSLPAGLSTATAIVPLKAPSSTTEPITLFSGIGYQNYIPFAVDAGMNVVWYAPTRDIYMTNPVPGGGYIALYGYSTDLANSGFKQYDLAGNLVKQTNVERMNDQLAANSMNPVTVFHHEVRKLANGNYLLMAQTEEMNTPQGAGVDVAGDMILILDSNLQLLWAWDAFNHLDVSRAALLGETCVTGPAACVLLQAPVANDWLHGNSVQLAPDGNLLYSSRHQDFVYKIAYQNGLGDGHVMWRLGKDGDFTWNSSDPWPWFSHQHDANYLNSTTISLFDDGNTRRQAEGGGNSRGQGLIVNETNMTVNFAINADLQRYCAALGSAQRLINGNYVFDCGLISVNPGLTQATEWTTAGTLVSNIQVNAVTYRVFRLSSLFTSSY